MIHSVPRHFGANSPDDTLKIGVRTCETWLRQFKSGEFDLTDNEYPDAAKKFEDEALQALLDEDPTQSQQQLAQTLNVTRGAIFQSLKAMGKIKK